MSEPKIMYRLCVYANNPIEAREVLRETKNCVFIFDTWRKNGEIKELKGDTWFATWSDAHRFLLNKAENKADVARSALKRADFEIDVIRRMKEPPNE